LTYRYERFIDLAFPPHDPVHPLTTGESPRTLFPLASGGVYDPLGDEQAPRRDTPISIQCSIVDEDPASFEATMRAWRAKRGKRGKLYRRWEDSQHVEWVYADLRSINGDRGVNNDHNQALQLNFVMQSPCWNGPHHGGGWTLDDGFFLDEGYLLDESDTYDLEADDLTFIPLTYGGDATVTNMTLLIYNPLFGIGPGGIDITNLTIKIGPDNPFVVESSWIYDGVIAPGDTLGISVGSRRVELNGVGHYNDFHLVDAEQHVDAWARLTPTGASGIRVEMTGGPSLPKATLTVSFWEGNE